VRVTRAREADTVDMREIVAAESGDKPVLDL